MTLRSYCKESEIDDIIEPCFWYEFKNNKAKLSIPKKDAVFNAFKNNIYPSGALNCRI